VTPLVLQTALQDIPRVRLQPFGDAYFIRDEMALDGYSCTPLLRASQRLMAADSATRLAPARAETRPWPRDPAVLRTRCQGAGRAFIGSVAGGTDHPLAAYGARIAKLFASAPRAARGASTKAANPAAIANPAVTIARFAGDRQPPSIPSRNTVSRRAAIAVARPMSLDPSVMTRLAPPKFRISSSLRLLWGSTRRQRHAPHGSGFY
jgi:hypothetical protein